MHPLHAARAAALAFVLATAACSGSSPDSQSPAPATTAPTDPPSAATSSTGGADKWRQSSEAPGTEDASDDLADLGDGGEFEDPGDEQPAYSYADCPEGGLEVSTSGLGAVSADGTWGTTVTVRNTSWDFSIDIIGTPKVSAHESMGSPFGSDGSARGVTGPLSPGMSQTLEYTGAVPDYAGGSVSLNVESTGMSVRWVAQDPFPDDFAIDSTCGPVQISTW